MENDRRTRRTKKLLTEAFIELLTQKKVTEISIKELCEMADINRGTFYLHYADIYDLKQQLEDEIMAQLEEIVLNHSSLQNSNDSYLLFLDLFRFSQKNAAFFKAFLGPHGDIASLNKMQTLFKEKYLAVLCKSQTPQPPVAFEYSYDFIASGFTGLVKNWLLTDNQPSPEEMAKLLNKIVYDGLPSLLAIP